MLVQVDQKKTPSLSRINSQRLFLGSCDGVAHSITGGGCPGGFFGTCRGDAVGVFGFFGATDELVELSILPIRIKIQSK